jgi:hypothetical protein
MATTCFFEKVIQDKGQKDAKMDLEFGRSSFYGDSLVYFTVDDNSVCVDEATGREIYDAMMRLGAYLGYDK